MRRHSLGELLTVRLTAQDVEATGTPARTASYAPISHPLTLQVA
jgi:hypothetical protein